MKKTLKVLLGLTLFFVSLTPVNLFAEESTNLMSVIAGMYDGSNDFRAYDESGQDVTDNFLTAIETYYLSNDEEAIENYIATNIDYLKCRVEIEMPTPYAATFTKCYVSEKYAEVLDQTQPNPGGILTIFYDVTAEPIYLLETSKIVTNPQPNITLTGASISTNLVKLFSISTMATLSSDEKTITYHWTFVPRARVTQYASDYEVAFERVNRSMEITPSTY